MPYRAADHCQRRWPDVVRDRRVVAVSIWAVTSKTCTRTRNFPRLPTGVNLARGRLYLSPSTMIGESMSHPISATTPTGTQPCSKQNINYTGIKPLTFTVGYTHPFVSVGGCDIPGQFAVSREAKHHHHRAERRGRYPAFRPRWLRGDRGLFRIRLPDRPYFWRPERYSPQ